MTHTVLPQIRRTGVYSPATQHEINASIFNGQTRMVRGYTEADRPLLDQVWAEKFGGAA